MGIGRRVHIIPHFCVNPLPTGVLALWATFCHHVAWRPPCSCLDNVFLLHKTYPYAANSMIRRLVLVVLSAGLSDFNDSRTKIEIHGFLWGWIRHEQMLHWSDCL